MRCTICDKCGKIIEDPKKVRYVTISRPIKPPKDCKCPPRGDDPQYNDILCRKEICVDCESELEAFLERTENPAPDEQGTTDPTTGGDGNDAGGVHGE